MADQNRSKAVRGGAQRLNEDEKERLQNLPSSKAKGWRAGFEREIKQQKDLMRDMRNEHSVPADTCAFHRKKINAEVTNMTKKVKEFDAALAGGEDACAAVVETCKPVLDSSKDEVKRWKKTVRNFK